MHSCIHEHFKRDFKELRGVFANISDIMDFGRRTTHKYSFKSPDVVELKKLGALVSDTVKFRDRYGSLLYILNIKVEDGVLNTLVQFYDPLHHCFTFPDYQLLPTLEEYS